MDDDNGLGIRNWGYYEPTVKGNLGLQLMSTMVDRDTKSSLAGRDSSAAVMMNANGGYHHHRECGVLESSLPMEYVRDGWFSQRDRLLHVLPGNANFPVLSESSGSHGLQMLPQHSSPKDERVVRMDEVGGKREGPLKKRAGGRAPKSPKAKKPKRVVPKDETNSTVQRVKSGKKNMGMSINGIDMDISGITPPVCSCTGTPQQCYRWGCGGWQSACCTTSVSMYPLPSNTKRPGARIAGRKMSQGAFKKVLERLAAEGYNFSNPIDLRTHWAKHGTNKFVTIR